MLMQIGKLGVWTWLDGQNRSETAAFAQKVESLGYSALWVPEAVGRDPFTLLGFLAGQTSTLWLATGIANIYARDPMTMKACAKTLNDLSNGRLILGLGVSHGHLVSGIRKHEYKKPIPAMRDFLEAMEAALYMAHQPDKEGPVLLGALRKRMLALSAEKADGAHPYFVTPEHTARARKILGKDKLLAPEQMVIFETNPTKAREVARKAMNIYLGLPNYQNNLKEYGFTDEDFANGGSNRVVDAIAAWGDEKAIAQRIQEHFDAGADHVCIQPLRPDGEGGYDMRILEALAPAKH